MSDAKQRAQDGLLDLVDDAVRTVGQSLKGTLRPVRGTNPEAMARWLLECVFERPDADELPTRNADGSTATDDLADRREALKQALRTRRADPSR